MRFAFVILTALTLSISAYAGTLRCESWYQVPGSTIEKGTMSLRTETANDAVYAGSYKGYDFKVDWNRELTVFYTSIERNGAYILSTTARVPTDNHPESFTDLNLPGGPRLAVNCEVK